MSKMNKIEKNENNENLENIENQLSEISTIFDDLIIKLKHLRTGERTELNRKLSICITESEKLNAYYGWYIMAEDWQ